MATVGLCIWKSHNHHSVRTAKGSVLWVLIAFFLSFSSVATALSNEEKNAQATLEKQREIYGNAQKALKNRQYTAFDQLSDSIQDYPLYPYLHFEQLARNLASIKQTEFDAFYQAHKDTPVARRLQIRWLRYLAKQKRWNSFLQNFPEHTSSASLNCQRAWGLLQTGKKDKAFQQAEALWLVGKSQPKSCDPLFAQWIKAGNATEAVAWQRFWMAILNNQSTLANYLTRFINSAEKQKAAKQAVSLLRNPSLLAKQSLEPTYERNSELIALLIKRLIRKQPELSIKLWQQYQGKLLLTDTQKAQVVRRLGLYLLKSYHPKSEEWLAQIDPNHSDEHLLEWQLRFQLSQHDWDATGDLIKKLPLSLKNKDRWKYWEARYLLVTGEAQQAQAIFADVAKNRNFYGFLAAQHIGLQYQLNHLTKPINQTTLDMLENLPAITRARELYFHDDLSNARVEWWRVSRTFTKDQHYHAGLLAQRWGWESQGITGAISSRHWDDLELRFPAPYKDKITAKANEFNIDDQWVYAIARQESAFKADVRSPAGAVGLMQLMPRTAQQTAKNIKLNYKGSYQLVNPETNITLGSAYLAQMYKKHHQNRVYATAAYNAGPYRVSQWIKQRGSLPIDIWVETIPFDETRQYVQNVLSYAVIYSEKLGKPMEFMTAEESKTLTGLNAR